jgi:hypothetical protein
MKKLLPAGVAALFLATGTASAMNSYEYKCGPDVDVRLAIVKDNGKVVGRNVWTKVKLRGDYPEMKKGRIRVRT